MPNSQSPNPRANARVSARHEALAAMVLERQRGRAALSAAPRAGKLADTVLAPILKDTGAGLGHLQRHWADIVGERLAGLTAPEKLSGGTLTVKAHSSAAPFVQHQSKLIVERANLAGARITGLAIRQGAIAARKANIAPLARPLTAEEEAAIAAALGQVSPGRLRDALMRLGRAVAAR